MKTTVSDSISIRDNNSQILSILPKELVEPLIILAKIKGYDGIDDYVLHLIKDRLEMFTDTRDELGESFQKYMQDIMEIPPVKEESAGSSNDDEKISKFMKKVHDEYHNNNLQDDEQKGIEDLK